jgi:tetratricopeptide (TPR) repeat protein
MKAVHILLILIMPCWLFGQTVQIENLRKALPKLKDSARIDSMNELSLQYINMELKDSAEYYASKAYVESRALNYIHGEAVSRSHQAKIKTQFHADFVEAENLYREAVSLFDKTNNKRSLADTYGQLGFACFVQGKYDEALDVAQEGYRLYKKNLDVLGQADILGMITQVYLKRGEFDKGFDAAREVLQLRTSLHIQSEIKGSLLNFGSLCMGIEDYPLALDYYRSYFENFTAKDSLDLIADEDLVWSKMEFAEIYSHLNMLDSALYLYNQFDTMREPENNLRIFLVSKGEYFMLSGQYEKALPSLLRGLAIHRKLNDVNEIVRTVLDIAATYDALHNNQKALLYAREGLNFGLQTRARQRMRDAYKVMYSVFDRQEQTDSAYFYYRAYIKTKESLTDDQTKGKFAAYNYNQKIEVLNNEKLIAQQKLKIKEQELKGETLLRNILIAFVFIVFMLSLLLLRNILLKRRNEKLKNENIHRELNHKSMEMEMQSLRAQMNPHFIFNCLNSINRFIMKNESQAASDYLTQFSRLIRLVLNNSKKSWIPLEDEVDMLRLYLDMEKLRFKDAFNYLLVFDEHLDSSAVSIPPLLLQPFVENAVWHGLMHKKENGLVTISFKVEKNILNCTIVDNGVGRAAAAAAGSKSSQNHKSLGIRITRERLALINGNAEDEKVVFAIEDLFDNNGDAAGTKVSLKIKLQQANSNEKEIHNSLINQS